jgi:tripartite-type tricarboxylate transporter receptor subunit TctC
MTSTHAGTMGTMNFWVGILAASLFSGLALTPPAGAEAWPHRAVRLIVPTGPGSSADVGARLFADRLADRWKHPVVVENRPGAEGIIGVEAFLSQHDDHVLLVSFAGPMSVLPVTQEKLPYDPVRDLVPISSNTDIFATVAATATLGIGSLSELVTTARSQPGKLNYHAAPGAFPILFAGFVKSAGLDMVPVSYRASVLSTQDLVEGRIQIVITPLTNVLSQARAGKVRLLAVTNKVRSPLALDVPSALEAGQPVLSFESFTGFFGTRDVAPALRDRISADVRAIASDPAIAEHLAAAGLIAHGSTPAEFAAAIDEQRAKIAAIARSIGLKPTQ